MSVQILNPKSIASIADFLYHITQWGGESTGIFANEKLKKSIRDMSAFENEPFYDRGDYGLFISLSSLNRQAYNERYAHCEHVSPAIIAVEAMPGDYPRWESDAYEDSRRIQPASRYQLLKTLDCFIYQVEDYSERREHIETLKSVRDALRVLIIANSEQYHVAIWA